MVHSVETYEFSKDMKSSSVFLLVPSGTKAVVVYYVTKYSFGSLLLQSVIDDTLLPTRDTDTKKQLNLLHALNRRRD